MGEKETSWRRLHGAESRRRKHGVGIMEAAASRGSHGPRNQTGGAMEDEAMRLRDVEAITQTCFAVDTWSAASRAIRGCSAAQVSIGWRSPQDDFCFAVDRWSSAS